jgi:hypothetical protein
VAVIISKEYQKQAIEYNGIVFGPSPVRFVHCRSMLMQYKGALKHRCAKYYRPEQNKKARYHYGLLV